VIRAIRFRFGLAAVVAGAMLAGGLATAARAQEAAEKPEVKPGWSQSLVGGLSFTQTEFENYAEGGESSLTWTALLTYKADEIRKRREWKTEAEAQFGQTRLGSGDLRKAVDKVKVISVNTWKLGEVVDPYVSADAQTQFAPGYVYSDNAPRVKVSKFANPLYVNEAAGVSRTLEEDFVTRLGVAVHEVFVTDTTFAAIKNAAAKVDLRYTDDPATAKIEKTRVDTGLESVTEYERAFNQKKLNVKSRLRLFSKFDDLATVDVLWNTKVTANLISFVNVILETEVLYDADIVKRTQFKEVLSLGMTHSFF
jgi:hypothetical protein